MSEVRISAGGRRSLVPTSTPLGLQAPSIRSGRKPWAWPADIAEPIQLGAYEQFYDDFSRDERVKAFMRRWNLQERVVPPGTAVIDHCRDQLGRHRGT